MSIINIGDFTKENVYFISDTHFFHENIIKYCKRPFSNAEEMNIVMFENWNNTVTDDDIVFFLGDFVVGAGQKKKYFCDLMNEQLNGKKIFLRGNHDSKDLYVNEYFDFKQIVNIRYKEHIISLNHFPNTKFSGDFLFHGHIHEKENEKMNLFNCSVEVIDYKPIHIDNILKQIKKEVIENG